MPCGCRCGAGAGGLRASHPVLRGSRQLCSCSDERLLAGTKRVLVGVTIVCPAARKTVGNLGFGFLLYGGLYRLFISSF